MPGTVPDPPRRVADLIELTEAQARQLAALRSQNEALEARVRFDGHAMQMLAHELRSPLTVLVGLLDILSTQQLDDETRAQLIARCAAQSSYLSNVADDLLAAPRDGGFTLPRAALRAVRLHDLVVQAVSTVSRLGSAERVRNLVDPTLMVLTAPSRFVAIIVNLIDNAAKYGGDGSIEVDASADDHDWRLVVRDHGPGFGDADPETLFEAFVRGREQSVSEDGFGAGLFVVRMLARSLGGDAALYPNDEGGGTTAIVTLPRRRQADPPPPPLIPAVSSA